MNLGVIYRPGHFQRVKDIKESDVMAKFKHDELEPRDIVEIATKDLIKLEDSTYLPGTMKPAFDEIRASGMQIDNIYTFISTKVDAKTYGRHYDDENVLLIQAIGKMMYKFDDGSSCVIEPGDSIYIPSDVYHTPQTMGPRVTISCKID
jgi:ribosomal protein L16 Arg81 hydroxylase